MMMKTSRHSSYFFSSLRASIRPVLKMIIWMTRTMISISTRNKMRLRTKRKRMSLISTSDMRGLVASMRTFLSLKHKRKRILHLLLILSLKSKSHLTGNPGEQWSLDRRKRSFTTHSSLCQLQESINFTSMTKTRRTFSKNSHKISTVHSNLVAFSRVLPDSQRSRFSNRQTTS